jgi:hypothetical protein
MYHHMVQLGPDVEKWSQVLKNAPTHPHQKRETKKEEIKGTKEGKSDRKGHRCCPHFEGQQHIYAAAVQTGRSRK